MVHLDMVNRMKSKTQETIPECPAEALEDKVPPFGDALEAPLAGAQPALTAALLGQRREGSG